MRDLLSLPIDASAHGASIDEIIVLLHWLMAFLFVVWSLYFVYTLFRFRSARSPKADYAGVKTHASSYLEVAVALFEGVILIGFAIPVWADVVTTFPAEEDAVVIHVVAEQFAWNIHYPGADGKFGPREIERVSSDNPVGLNREHPDGADDITTINQLTIPVNKNILIYLSSKDVIHSFGIPLLRVKQDAIPGQRIPISFKPTMTDAEIRRSLTRPFDLTGDSVPRELVNRIAAADYPDVEVTAGDLLTSDIIAELQAAGLASILATQDTPMEIACAQLCGLGHYRMRGTVTVMTEGDYRMWLEEEAAWLE